MRPFFPVIFSLAAISILTLISFLLIRLFNVQWWQHQLVQRALKGIPVIGIGLCLIWSLAILTSQDWLLAIGAAGMALVFIIIVAFFLALPLSSLFNLLNRLWDWAEGKVKTSPSPQFSTSRRRFLQTTALAFPALTITGGLTGLAKSFQEVRLPLLPLKFKNLPLELEGLKIFHLSDIHLGYYVQMRNIEALLSRVADHQFDLVLLSGDIADKVDLLPEVLQQIESLQPRYGTFASLGNHEYFRGIKAVLKHFDRSTVPLLYNSGQNIRVNGVDIFVGGADDPQRIMRRDSEEFLRTTVGAAFEHAPSDSFKIMLSHRPDGFVHASDLGVDLTLAGHTHGMQVGIDGRSVFENWAPEKYLWGHYKRGESQLYTSSGVGHWFPYRLGCPAEAPIIVLQRVVEDEGDFPKSARSSIAE